MTICFIFISAAIQANDLLNNPPTGATILKNIDNNLHVDKAITHTKMVIYRRNRINTIKAKTWISGKYNAFTEYLYPLREKGKKMLKLGDKLWTYIPEPSDRIITISGHMLRQSLMGSDLSYEDMMNNDPLTSQYNAKVIGLESLLNRECLVLELVAKLNGLSYERRKLWVDPSRWLPLKEELFAKSGKLLKRTVINEVFKVEGRWYPKKMTFKDMLSKGKGTEYHIESIEFKKNIPSHIFSKAALRK